MTYVEQALAAVEGAIDQHQRGDLNAPFSAKFLASVRDDLERMAASPDYRPAYPRFILDWPDSSGSLGKQLMQVSDLRYRALQARG